MHSMGLIAASFISQMFIECPQCTKYGHDAKAVVDRAPISVFLDWALTVSALP